MLQRGGSRCNRLQQEPVLFCLGREVESERTKKEKYQGAGVARTVKLCVPAASELAVPNT
jgi:hypothetical protein